MTDDHLPDEVGNDSDIPRRGASDAPLVERVRAGDQRAFGELYDRWFDRVLDLSWRILHDEQAAADAAQDAFLSAWRNLDKLDDAHAFGGWLLRIARNGAIDRQRKDQRVRPVDTEQFAVIERTQLRPEDTLANVNDPARVAEDAVYVEMVWDAAEALGERDREVLDLNLRHGLAPTEIADVIGINRNAANQLVHRVKQRLATAVAARVLWRAGEPSCAALRAELVAADVEHFGADAMRVTDRHAAGCAECTENKRLRLAPEKMFSAIPIIALPSLKTKVAHALDAASVPMEGSRAFTDGDTTGAGRRGRGRRIALGTGAIVALIIAVVLFSAAALDHDPDGLIAVDAGATTTVPKSTTSASTNPSTSTTTNTRPIVIPPVVTTIAPPLFAPATTPPAAPVTTTTQPRPTTTTIPVDTTLTLVPARQTTNCVIGQTCARLTWSVQHAASVLVYDDADVFDSTKFSGSAITCPKAGAQSLCGAAAGDYVYTLDAFDAAGHRIGRRRVTLTIG